MARARTLFTRRRLGALLLLALTTLGLSAAALHLAPTPRPAQAAEQLVADLDDHLVAITAGFTGTELLLFGSIEGTGEVVVVVHGPKEDVVVRRKDRIAGVWVNRAEMTFKGVPAFYHVATSAPREALNLPDTALRRHQIGVENIRLRLAEGENPDMRQPFAEAIVRNKIRVGHYSEEAGRVEWRGGRLFRTTVLIPANVPVGTYTVETLLVQGGEVVSAQTTPLFVNKEGFGAQVFRAANMFPAYYGLAAILIAGFAGFAANWIFRKL
ncbi:MAG: TIGR02186 family protein [Marivibrio sp.]|uniref:TIGR02186 family protein n=1 Tax=Marivibrio sp. TaxID=2039719 RepID=UPI0032F088C8